MVLINFCSNCLFIISSNIITWDFKIRSINFKYLLTYHIQRDCYYLRHLYILLYYIYYILYNTSCLNCGLKKTIIFVIYIKLILGIFFAKSILIFLFFRLRTGNNIIVLILVSLFMLYMIQKCIKYKFV